MGFITRSMTNEVIDIDYHLTPFPSAQSKNLKVFSFDVKKNNAYLYC